MRPALECQTMPPNRSRALPPLAVSVGIFGVLSIGCGFGTDAATRLAYDVVENAAMMRQDGEELTFTHVPRSWPEGCSSGYTIELQESLHHPAAGGSLLVDVKASQTFANSDTATALRTISTRSGYRPLLARTNNQETHCRSLLRSTVQSLTWLW